MRRPAIIRAGFWVLSLLGFAAVAAAQASAQEAGLSASSQVASSQAGTVSTPSPGLQQRNPRYRLRRGDSFTATFALAPEFDQSIVVEPDGFVTLKEAGSVSVEGLTVPELIELLKHAYAGILRDPVVSVSLKDFDRPYFIATGQVNKPGKYDLRGPLTVTEAVAIAGGFNNDAKRNQIVLFHPTPNGVFEAKLLDVRELLRKRNLNEDILLQPGDLVYVPETRIGKIRQYLPNTAVGAYYNPGNY